MKLFHSKRELPKRKDNKSEQGHLKDVQMDPLWGPHCCPVRNACLWKWIFVWDVFGLAERERAVAEMKFWQRYRSLWDLREELYWMVIKVNLECAVTVSLLTKIPDLPTSFPVLWNLLHKLQLFASLYLNSILYIQQDYQDEHPRIFMFAECEMFVRRCIYWKYTVLCSALVQKLQNTDKNSTI